MSHTPDKHGPSNRLVKLTKGYRDSGGTLQTGSDVAAMYYDGMGRRSVGANLVFALLGRGYTASIGVGA